MPRNVWTMSETAVPKQGIAQLQYSTIKCKPKHLLKTVDAEVGKQARWLLLASLKLITACIAV